jgi:hypothetical protein
MRRAPAYFVALLIILTIDQFTAQGASSSAQYTRIQAIITEPVEKTALSVLVKALKERRGVPVTVTADREFSRQQPTTSSIYMATRRTLPQSTDWANALREIDIKNDGYAIVEGHLGSQTLWILADQPRGLLYGVYALLDHYGIPYEPEQPARSARDSASQIEVSNPAFRRRIAGTGYWEFLTEDSLRRWFRALSSQRINGFVAFMSFTNYADLAPFKDLWGEPFGHLLEFNEYPKLQWAKKRSEQINKARRHLDRLIDIAEEYGIDVYLGSWEIGYPTEILTAYPELGRPTPMSISNPETEKYVRSRFKELANRFPRIKGVVYNGVESHSYVMKSEKLPGGTVVSRAERRKKFSKWAIESLREVIPEAILVTMNGPFEEVKETYIPGTIFAATIVGSTYSTGPRPVPQVVDGLGLTFLPVPQGLLIDETKEYRAQNAIPVADIYGWSARVAPTYRQGGFNEMLLCYTRSIPGQNPSGAYGMDVMNLHSFGSLAWDPSRNPDEILRHWAQRFFPDTADVMYEVAARSPEIFLGIWRKADNSAYVPRAPWFNYQGLSEADLAVRVKALRMAREDFARVDALRERIEPQSANLIISYLRSRVHLADYLFKVAQTDRALSLAIKNRTPRALKRVELAVASSREAVDRLDFPASPWIDFRGHVSPDFARRMFSYFATQVQWLSSRRLEVIERSQPSCSDVPRNVMGIKGSSAHDQYFNSAQQLIDQVIAPTVEEQNVDQSAFSHPWITASGWPQAVILEFVRQQPVESLTLHHTNIKSAAIWIKAGNGWQPLQSTTELDNAATTFRFTPSQVSAVAVVVDGAANTDQKPARAMELTWSPLEAGGLVGREYSACSYYHLRR